MRIDDEDPDKKKASDAELSSARAIKKKIDDGSYEVDVAALANALMDNGALEAAPEPDAEAPDSAAADLERAQNDQKARD